MSAPVRVVDLHVAPPDAPAPERYLSPRAAAELLDVGIAWVHRAIAAGRLPSVRLRSSGDPRRWPRRIPASAIRAVVVEGQ